MTIENFKDLTNRVAAIQSYLKIDEKRMHLKEAELKTQDPSFWNDPKKAEEQMKSIRVLKYWVESFDKSKASVDDLEVLYEFVKEGMTSEADLDKSYKNILNCSLIGWWAPNFICDGNKPTCLRRSFSTRISKRLTFDFVLNLEIVVFPVYVPGHIMICTCFDIAPPEIGYSLAAVSCAAWTVRNGLISDPSAVESFPFIDT